MYAIFSNGGKQYKVSKGDIIQLEKIIGKIGEKIEFQDVLMIKNNEKLNIGNPIIMGARITAKLLFHGKLRKIKIIKFHRRKHFRKKQGHRQYFTNVKIIKINNE
ncbi:50S ribosomal protein L21 [Enterobacteriaceae endosymbiont of Donacia tomentosa]|uniref:50S ribosomal protein L21 n=1 Tax=Enterobacteriaceae endosymbiont of Donacia tomentosa TaxID=2675787 RepID=UPI0014494321|nr:50S ribosomal protein L21 [Enterobacteriaceae endosymbiont of Donacia tomentosa]QJC31863.1 50S ribosomal protein L21 [Enterobacteriaceae endosymbiont of Donacia tomentosa]